MRLLGNGWVDWTRKRAICESFYNSTLFITNFQTPHFHDFRYQVTPQASKR